MCGEGLPDAIGGTLWEHNTYKFLDGPFSLVVAVGPLDQERKAVVAQSMSSLPLWTAIRPEGRQPG